MGFLLFRSTSGLLTEFASALSEDKWDRAKAKVSLEPIEGWKRKKTLPWDGLKWVGEAVKVGWADLEGERVEPLEQLAMFSDLAEPIKIHFWLKWYKVWFTAFIG